MEIRADEISEILKSQIQNYEARVSALEQASFGAPPYKPVPAERMFLSEAEWNDALESRTLVSLSPFEVPEESEALRAFSLGGRRGR